jgi:hypothetical protein
MNQLVNSNSLKDVSKFYDTLYKRGSIKAYGSMNQDGPLNSLRFPDLEFMLYNDPPSVFRLTGINSEHLENLEIPNYNTKGYTSLKYDIQNQEFKNPCLYAGIFFNFFMRRIIPVIHRTKTYQD